MSNFIRRRERIERTNHVLSFDYIGQPGSGYGFDCDADGKVDKAAMSQRSRDTYDACRRGCVDGHAMTSGYVRSFDCSYWEPAAIRCACGRELVLHDHMTNECDCGRFYNGSGQSLAHPSQWGEDTGERFDDHGGEIL